MGDDRPIQRLQKCVIDIIHIYFFLMKMVVLFDKKFLSFFILVDLFLQFFIVIDMIRCFVIKTF